MTKELTAMIAEVREALEYCSGKTDFNSVRFVCQESLTTLDKLVAAVEGMAATPPAEMNGKTCQHCGNQIEGFHICNCKFESSPAEMDEERAIKAMCSGAFNHVSDFKRLVMREAFQALKQIATITPKEGQ